MNPSPYRERDVPANLCPDCLHTWSAHDPSREKIDAYCVLIGLPKIARLKPPRCHVSHCPCKRAR
jgi:hypothetical protein